MAVAYFMKLTDQRGVSILGDATHKGHEGWIELYTWSFESDSPAGGTGAGRVKLSGMSFSKRMDKASPALTLAAMQGQKSAALLDIVMDRRQDRFIFKGVEIQSGPTVYGRLDDDRPIESCIAKFAEMIPPPSWYNPSMGD